MTPTLAHDEVLLARLRAELGYGIQVPLLDVSWHVWRIVSLAQYWARERSLEWITLNVGQFLRLRLLETPPPEPLPMAIVRVNDLLGVTQVYVHGLEVIHFVRYNGTGSFELRLYDGFRTESVPVVITAAVSLLLPSLRLRVFMERGERYVVLLCTPRSACLPLLSFLSMHVLLLGSRWVIGMRAHEEYSFFPGIMFTGSGLEWTPEQLARRDVSTDRLMTELQEKHAARAAQARAEAEWLEHQRHAIERTIFDREPQSQDSQYADELDALHKLAFKLDGTAERLTRLGRREESDSETYEDALTHAEGLIATWLQNPDDIETIVGSLQFAVSVLDHMRPDLDEHTYYVARELRGFIESAIPIGRELVSDQLEELEARRRQQLGSSLQPAGAAPAPAPTRRPLLLPLRCCGSAS